MHYLQLIILGMTIKSELDAFNPKAPRDLPSNRAHVPRMISCPRSMMMHHGHSLEKIRRNASSLLAAAAVVIIISWWLKVKLNHVPSMWLPSHDHNAGHLSDVVSPPFIKEDGRD